VCSAPRELQREKNKKTIAHDLAISCGHHEIRGAEEEWWFLTAQLLGLRPLRLQPLLYLRVRHHTHGVLLLSRRTPSYTRGGREVLHRLSAPLVRQEVPDPLGLPPSYVHHNLYPQDCLLRFPLGAVLKEAVPGLSYRHHQHCGVVVATGHRMWSRALAVAVRRRYAG